MSRIPRPVALALKTTCAALLLALAGSASAVLLDNDSAGDEVLVDTAALSAGQLQTPAHTLMTGNPPVTTGAVRRNAVVEPGTLALLGLGLVIIGLTNAVRPRNGRGGSDKRR